MKTKRKKIFVLIFVLLGIGLVAADSTPQKQHYEPLRCDSLSQIGTIQWQEAAAWVYRNDSLRRFSRTTSNAVLIVRETDGSFSKKGITKTGATFGDSPPSEDEKKLLNSLWGDPELLYTRWEWLLSEPRAAFLSQRDAFLDSLRRRFPQFTVKVVSDIRSAGKQTTLVNQGKSMAPLSFHQIGLAADIGLFRGKTFVRNGGPYMVFGEIAPHFGLTWGGNFVGFVDPPHIQSHFNAAALLEKYPALAFEFDPFYEHYQKRVQQKKVANRLDLVQDTIQLLEVLNAQRQGKPCLCQKVKDISLETFNKNLQIAGFQGNNTFYVFADSQEQTISFWKDNTPISSYRLGIWQ